MDLMYIDPQARVLSMYLFEVIKEKSKKTSQVRHQSNPLSGCEPMYMDRNTL